MRIRVTMPAKDAKRIKDKLLSHFSNIDEEEWSNEVEVIGMMDPGKFRDLTALIQEESKGKGTVEVLSLRDIADSEEII